MFVRERSERLVRAFVDVINTASALRGVAVLINGRNALTTRLTAFDHLDVQMRQLTAPNIQLTLDRRDSDDGDDDPRREGAGLPVSVDKMSRHQRTALYDTMSWDNVMAAGRQLADRDRNYRELEYQQLLTAPIHPRWIDDIPAQRGRSRHGRRGTGQGRERGHVGPPSRIARDATRE